MKIEGVKVIDAKKPLALSITKRDVTRGNTKEPNSCAAAQACSRLPGVEAARIHIARSYLKIEGKWVRYQTNPALRSEIVAFDRGGTFEPGDYVLSPIPPASRPNGKRQGSSVRGARDKGSKNRTPKRARAKPHTITGIRGHGNSGAKYG